MTGPSLRRSRSRSTMTTPSYTRKAVDHFAEEYGEKLKLAASPYISEKDWAAVDGTGTEGRFKKTCTSHVDTLLFLARVCRPDRSVAVRWLCSAVSRWATVHDKALARLFSDLSSKAEFSLCRSLSPDDIDDVIVRVFTDADWNGEDESTRSTSGVYVEIAGRASGRA